MRRREFVSGGLGLAAALGGAAGAETAPPNVVLIYHDDLGYGDLGCYGSKLGTPTFDRVAREGVRFTDFYSGNPVCSPSRAALLTGRYCVRAGVPRVFFPQDTTGLPQSEVTLAQVLKAREYRTMCVGKWHLGHHPEYLPTARGFDHYFGIPYSNDMVPRVLMEDARVVEEQTPLDTLTERYTKRAVQFIEQSKGNPFFLYLPHTYPHIPLGASARFRSKSPSGLYGDVIAELDWSLGEVLGALKRTGVEGNTLVLVSSDNGPWYQGSAGALRGRKGSTWEGGQRVPLLARWPGRIPAGVVSSGVSSVMDIVPTVTKLCGARGTGNRVDGVDIWPLLNGSRKEVDRDVLLYFDHLDLQCGRWGKWKLHVARHNVQAYDPAPPGGKLNLPLPRPELYDLSLDPAESYDVAPENPGVVREIMRRMDRLMAGMPEAVRQARAATLGRKSGASSVGAVTRVER